MQQATATALPANHESEWWQRLADFEAPFLQEKLLADQRFPDEATYEAVFMEWKRYMALSQWTDGVAMTSKDVDAVWHQFILFTREYHNFCEELFGHYVHHVPATPSQPLPPDARERFEAAYVEHFGPLPDVWGGPGDCKSDCKCEKGKCTG